MAESTIDAVLRLARQTQPDLWKRTEQVARIIDPAAFMDDWIARPEQSAILLSARLQAQRANAMRRAQDVLTYLGVNTETEWFEILTRLAREGAEGRKGKD